MTNLSWIIAIVAVPAALAPIAYRYWYEHYRQPPPLQMPNGAPAPAPARDDLEAQLERFNPLGSATTRTGTATTARTGLSGSTIAPPMPENIALRDFAPLGTQAPHAALFARRSDDNTRAGGIGSSRGGGVPIARLPPIPGTPVTAVAEGGEEGEEDEGVSFWDMMAGRGWGGGSWRWGGGERRDSWGREERGGEAGKGPIKCLVINEKFLLPM